MKNSMLVLVAGCLIATGCSSPTGPSSQSAPLEGTWRGSISISRDGTATVQGSTSWTFRPMGNGAGVSYDTDIVTDHPLLARSVRSTAVLVSPGAQSSQFQADGSYIAPSGCHAAFSSLGTAERNRITASFHGVDCSSTFNGTVELSR